MTVFFLIILIFTALIPKSHSRMYRNSFLRHSLLAVVGAAMCIITVGCNPIIGQGVRKSDLRKDVELTTSYGTVVFRLSDETPLHRNNFLSLVHRHVYDSLLFHRVINHFLIQTGDPTSKHAVPDALLGEGDLTYTVPAEINEHLFHKRGAINAARTSDDENPLQASSSTQFTLIQGRIYTDSTLDIAENRINYMRAYNRIIRRPANAALFDHLQRIQSGKASADSLAIVRAALRTLAQDEMAGSPRYRIPAEHRQLYKTIGGAAHLDGSYTVFGEVVSGMEVVDKIATQKTNAADRPVEDIRILSVRLIKRK